MGKVYFNYADKQLAFKNKRLLKKQVEQIFELESKELKRIDYVFCSDKYLLIINQRFLHHDFLTDIITFDLSESTATIGEVYISIDRVQENAIINHVSFASEITRVIIHGALHLCGYKDKKKSEKVAMHNKEDYYLHLFGL